MKKEVVAGIDIGGTKVAVALQTLGGQQVATRRLSTEVTLGPHQILENVISSVEELISNSNSKAMAIGIVCPGPIDIERGLVMSPANLKDWIDFPIVEIVKKRFGVPVVLDNDANAAGLGEYFYGAGKGFKDIFYVTISTGIGGAIIFDGKLHYGVGASAGEIGHTVVKPDGIVCQCGTRGCLETIASGLSIARRMKEKLAEINGNNFINPDEITAETVVKAVRNGDETALFVWDEACQYLGIGLANAITFIAPEAVVIGGGVSNVGELLLEPLRREIKKHVTMLPIEKVTIMQASLGSESGVCGALMLAQQAFQKSSKFVRI